MSKRTKNDLNKTQRTPRRILNELNITRIEEEKSEDTNLPADKKPKIEQRACGFNLAKRRLTSLMDARRNKSMLQKSKQEIKEE